MKNIQISLIAYATLSASLLLTACGGDTQTQLQPSSTVSSSTGIDQNSRITNELVNMASSSSAHWLTPTLLVMPKSDKAEIYQLLNTSNCLLYTSDAADE